MEFAYIFRALLRRKWIIIISVVVALGAAYFFTRGAKKVYKSSAQISTGFTFTDVIKLTEETAGIPQIDMKFNNAIENMTSTKVLSQISYRLLQHDLTDPKPFTALTKEQQGQVAKLKTSKTDALVILQHKLDSIGTLSPAVPAEREVLAYIDAYNYGTFHIFKNLKVARFQRTDYINIDHASLNPDLSAFVVNTLCREFSRFYGQQRVDRTDISVVSLDSVMQAKKLIYDTKVLDKNNYNSSNGVVDVGMETSSILGQVSAFEAQKIDEEANQASLEYQIGELNKLIKTAQDLQGNPNIGKTNPDLATNNAEYGRLRKEYNDVNAEYIRKGANDPVLRRRLSEIKGDMAKLNMGSGTTKVNNNFGGTSAEELIERKIGLEGLLRSSVMKISSLQSAISRLNGGKSGMATKGASIDQLNKEIEIALGEYQKASNSYNEALKLNNATAGNFKQTIFGEPAQRPIPNKTMMIIALAGICALVISSLVIIGIEFFDQSVKTPSQFQRLTDLPLLGTINSVKLTNNNILEHVTLFDGKDNRDNIFRELIRKIRYEIENSNKKIFLFTSTEPNQGKTMLIQSIAYSLSLSKKRVLIIDTNFCNNDLTKATNATPALERFSLNGKPFEVEGVASYISKTAAEGVDIIGCEGGDYTPSEILPKNHLLNYLGQLKTEYDYIFMEGAPLNIFTDTKELVKYADGLIAIFSADANFTAADKESIGFLIDNKEKFLGAILNKVQEDNLNL